MADRAAERSTSEQAAITTCPHCGRRNRVRAVAPAPPHCGACGKPLPWLVEADEATFPAAVERSPLPVLVDFWAPWCAPCRIVEPVVEGLSRDLAGKLKVVKVNSDLAPQLSQHFEVRGIPTLIVFDNGKVVDRLTGAPQPTVLRNWVQTQVASRKRD